MSDPTDEPDPAALEAAAKILELQQLHPVAQEIRKAAAIIAAIRDNMDTFRGAAQAIARQHAAICDIYAAALASDSSPWQFVRACCERVMPDKDINEIRDTANGKKGNA